MIDRWEGQQCGVISSGNADCYRRTGMPNIIVYLLTLSLSMFYLHLISLLIINTQTFHFVQCMHSIYCSTVLTGKNPHITQCLCESHALCGMRKSGCLTLKIIQQKNASLFSFWNYCKQQTGTSEYAYLQYPKLLCCGFP